jgi:hypothetical protein
MVGATLADNGENTCGAYNYGLDPNLSNESSWGWILDCIDGYSCIVINNGGEVHYSTQLSMVRIP